MSPSQPDARPLVLVVDDDPDVLEMLWMALRHHGFDVALAPSGAEAVRLFRAAPADVVLCDVQMPGLDGPGTLAGLRAVGPAVRCVFMSGLSDRYTTEELLGLGAAAVLDKPFRSLAELVGLLRR